MTPDEAEELVGSREVVRVRVWDAQHASVFVEGKVIAYSIVPQLCVEDDNGVRHWHGINLPIDVARWPRTER